MVNVTFETYYTQLVTWTCIAKKKY